MAKKGKKSKVGGGAGGKPPAAGDVATNRQARFNFEFVEKMEAGIQLKGTEVKALRDSGAQLNDSYAVVEKGEVWLRKAHIPPYAPAAQENHEPERPRKLLLQRREIERLVGKTAQKGLTLVPTRIYFKGRNAKVELALARHKEGRDKRRDIAKRDVEREIARDYKQRL
jgi:SsrA-binding protein